MVIKCMLPLFCLLLPANKSPLPPCKRKNDKEAATTHPFFQQIHLLLCLAHASAQTLEHIIKAVLSMISQRRKSSLFYRRKWQLHETKKLAHGHMVERERGNPNSGSAHFLTGHSNLELTVSVPEATPVPLSKETMAGGWKSGCKSW